MSGVLADILAKKRAEIPALRARLAARTEALRATRDVLALLARPPGAPLRLLAEHKRRSPSAGVLSTVLSPAARACLYAEAGAAMVSVLTDAGFFDGSWEHVVQARAALGEATPILAKEFVLDEIQIDAARAFGADTVLLIARIVDAEALARLVDHARKRGMEPLVEVATDHELESALAARAKLIGVNARDLDTLAMDREKAARVLANIPEDCVALHLSGLKTPEDVRAVATTRADGALVGEVLMRQDDPRPLLEAMARAAGK